MRVIGPVGEGDLEEGNGAPDSMLEILDSTGTVADPSPLGLAICSRLSSTLRSRYGGVIPGERLISMQPSLVMVVR